MIPTLEEALRDIMYRSWRLLNPAFAAIDASIKGMFKTMGDRLPRWMDEDD